MSNNRPTRRSRSSKNWKSSVLGSHASQGSSGLGSWGSRGASSRNAHGNKSAFSHRPARDRASSSSRAGVYEGAHRPVSLQGRTAELNQMRPTATPVDPRGSRRRPADPAELIRRRRRSFFIKIAIAVVIVIAVAVGLGGFVFQSTVSGNMSLKDDTVRSALVTPDDDSSPYYVLLAGSASDDGEASYLGVLRLDKQNNKLSLLNVPANIAASSSGQLRDLPVSNDGGTLVSEVSNLVGVPIAHYVGLTDKGLTSLVDAMGGIDVNVEKLVDDPRAGSIVIDPGQQTLNGEQVATYVRAFNYEKGREDRANIQFSVLQAIVSKASSMGGLDFMKTADSLSGGLQTDYAYDDLTQLLGFASGISNVEYGTIPGSDVSRQGRTFFAVSDSNWSKVQEKFQNGQTPSINYTTSKADKKKLSIIVLNGSGVTGNAQKAEKKLTSAGYSVKETGNAESFVYEETLVVYRSSDKQEDAQAIVDSLGVGRAVPAGVNYKLSTDIQIMVGKDWVS